MKKNLFITVLCFASLFAQAQNKKQASGQLSGLDSKTFLRSSSEEACKCIDSIERLNKSQADVSKEIGNCIDKQVVTYQMADKLFGSMDLNKEIEKALNGDTLKKKDKKNKPTVIDINTNQDSKDYKKYYYELERYMMDSCALLKAVINSNEQLNRNSVSGNSKAIDFYSKGQKDMVNQDYQQAVLHFESALKIDPLFAFAWDNLGLAYRKLNNYDKAIEAYNSSLKVDPDGLIPLQNIAVAYEYKKQYDKAIAAYERLAKLDKNNPEVYYGIGRIYVGYLEDFENGLQNLCKAYNIYTDQKSPYRTDAESMISLVYSEMKKQGKEKRFKEILTENHINPE